jgi:hypothetical protein
MMILIQQKTYTELLIFVVIQYFCARIEYDDYPFLRMNTRVNADVRDFDANPRVEKINPSYSMLSFISMYNNSAINVNK